ncbi:TonB-dependent receptor [Sunxiuqinia elliptica]
MKKKLGNRTWRSHVLLKTLKVMRLALFFTLVSIFQTVASTGYSQSAKITLKNEIVSLENVLNKIEDQSEYRFIYNKKQIDLDRKVKVNFEETTVEKILDELFINNGINYQLIDKQVILTENQRANSQQTLNVQGSVKDITGQPLPGVSIAIKGTTEGTVTNFDGNYSIEGVPGNAILVFSFVGMETQEVKVEGRAFINITLLENTSEINEVVVVGYGTQQKKDLTGAIASVDTEDFTPGANYDAVQLLNGTAAGVRVSQVNSAPGAGLQIQIRGAGSINSSNDALFVVDGLIGVNPSTLSTEDIESIQILKDASSAAIYGARGANGVVLISTKKGKKGKTVVTYNGYAGMQSVAKKLDVLGASDYMELVNMRLEDRGDNPLYSDQDIANAGVGTNWQDQLFRSAPIQNHQIGISGGSENSSYYIGLNYFNQKGIVEKSDNTKYNVRANLQSNPWENLKVSTSLNFTNSTLNSVLFSNAANEAAGPINSAIQYDPSLLPGLDENGEYYRNPSIALDNPNALIYGLTDLDVASTFYGTVAADYEFVKNLTATARLGAKINNSRSDNYRDKTTLNGLSSSGIASIKSEETTYWLTEYLLKYENTFNEKHKFSAMVGTTLEANIYRSVSASTAGFLSDVLGTNNLGTGDGDERDNVGSSKSKNQLHGVIGRVTYGFDNKYMLTASFRADGSSKFSDENKYAYFPSASAGWTISNEEFMANTGWVNNLKLRVGYGQIGNQGINNLETLQTLVANSGDRFVSGGEILQGVVPARLPNPALVWERTKEANLGVDFSIFEHRLSGSIDYFNRKTSDQLFFKPLPSVVGFTSVRTNIGEVVNKGVEVNLKSINIQTDNFTWRTSANLSFLKNEVTKLPDFVDEIIEGSIGTFTGSFNLTKVGLPIRTFYGYEIEGIIQKGEDLSTIAMPNVQGYGPGMPKFVNQNPEADNIIDSNDRVVLGDGFPDFSFGLDNSFAYKGFSLDVFILGVLGIETLDNNVIESLYPTNAHRNSISKYYQNRWTPENPSNSYPSGHNSSLYGGARAINSLTVTDASFARLKNVTLGYTFDSRSRYFSKLKFYLAADNLLTVSNFDGFDPDASANGAGGVIKTSYNNYPLAKTFRLGINVEF